MYRTFYFRIMDKDIKITTNSLILKNIIMDSFPIQNKKNKNYSMEFYWILKKPYDFEESISYFNKFVSRFLYEINNRYIILHGSSFSYKGNATLILGNSGRGKSSLLFSAALNGAKIITDEPILIERETTFALPFIYLVKITQPEDKFYINIYKNSNIIKFKNYKLVFFQRKTMEKMGISFEKKKTPIKNIIFLEEKKYPSLIHMAKYVLNSDYKIFDLFNSLNNIVCKKNVKFITEPFYIIRNTNRISDFLNNLL